MSDFNIDAFKNNMNIFKNNKTQKRGFSPIRMIFHKFLNKIKIQTIEKIKTNKTTPILQTNEEKRIAIENIEKCWATLEYYFENIFWKKLKESGVLKRLKIKGGTGLLLSIVSVIPGLGPLIVAPIKAFFIFLTSWMEFSSKYNNEIRIGKEAWNAVRNNENIINTVDLAQQYIQLIERNENNLGNLFKKGGYKIECKKSRKKSRKNNRKNNQKNNQKNNRKNNRKKSQKKKERKKNMSRKKS